KRFSQYVPDGHAIHLCRIEGDAQELRTQAAVVQVVARRQEGVVLVEELVPTPPCESSRRIVRSSNLRIPAAVLKVVQVIRRLVRRLAVEQRAQAQGRVPGTLQKLAPPGLRDRTGEAPLIKVRADGIKVKAGELRLLR